MTQNNKNILILILTIIIFILSKNIGIFWDNVLFVSKMGGYLYEHDIFNWLLPDNIDPGHPPFLGFIQAIGWKLLGKKLWVSHLIMTPFIYGLLFQLLLLVENYVHHTKYQYFSFFLILADPTLTAQLFYVSPEVIQLFFFFLAVNSILKNNIYLKTIGLFFLSIVSLRGMMLCAGVFIFELSRALFVYKSSVSKFIFNHKILLSYSIGAIPALSFIAWHIYSKGWLFTHDNSPWKGSNDIVGIKDLIFNIIVLIHRYLDFGRFGIVLFIILIIISKRKWLNNAPIKELLILSASSVLVIIIVSLLILNPMGHRYFIASYISLNLIAFLLLLKLKRYKKVVYSILFSLLITGNLWIYPEKIAQGWDASLAGLPYFKLRKDAIKYLDNRNIDINKVSTFFPNATKISNIDLNKDNRILKEFNTDAEYVLYSNVYNLSDEELEMLNKNYKVERTFMKHHIYVKILHIRTKNNTSY